MTTTSTETALNETVPDARLSIVEPTEAALDGGYGWVVVTACAMMTFCFVGVTYSWGIFQSALVDQGLSTPATLSFVGSSTVACIAIFAILNARLLNAIGARAVAILGVILLGGGEILSSFSLHSVAGLFVTVGGIMGIGARLVRVCYDGIYHC